MVITFDKVSFKYLEKMLLNEVSFSITDADKIGLIGVNGSGKSTMLKLICELEKPLKGNIIKSGGMIINYLPQEPNFEKNMTLIDCIMLNDDKLHKVNDYEAKSILNKLKLYNHEELAGNLSGGQLKRLALAKVLVTYCDFLILDEPTNHLDNDMIVWLEKYLKRFKKALIMVTHDRYFLERICNRMLEIDFANAHLYEANYSKFLELKEERIKNEAHQMQKLKSILRVEKAWMERGVEARRTKSKNRIERFEKMSEIEFNNKETFEFNSIKTRLGKKLIEIKNGTKAYGDKLLFNDFNFSLQKSDIVGLIGDNGAGKTTLFKIIMGEETLDKGELNLGETLNIGYFSQHLDIIDKEIRVIDYIKEESEEINTLDGKISAKQLLENFLFDSNMQYTKIKMLSGGEKRRLQLIKVLMKNPNLLILDEPTNDLDIYTLEILENYLESFHGPIIIVSHDRYFLDKVCNKLFAFENKKINEYACSFSEYIEINNKEEIDTITKPIRNKTNTFQKEKRELVKVEEEISKLELIIRNYEKELSLLTSEYTKIMDIHNKLQETKKTLDTYMEKYFELMAILEEN